MTALRASLLLSVLAAGVAMATAADAAPRVVFRGCAFWTMPGCLMMKATDGRTYQLLNAPPTFSAYTRAMVVGTKAGDVGTCFAPGAKFVGFRPLPPGPC